MNIRRFFTILAAYTALPFLLYAQESVAYQVNNSHTGATTMPGFSTLIEQKWAVNMEGPVSYPVLANGRVIVTARGTGGYGLQMHNLDAMSGQEVWNQAIPSTYWAGEPCYADGKVFTYQDNVSGPKLAAFDALTGARLWTQPLTGQHLFSSPPTAGNGMVYIGGAGSGGTLYAVRQADGKEMWRASVENGDHSSPVVTPDGVYVSYVGPQAYKFDPLTGLRSWHFSGPVAGGGGKTAVLFGGNLYVRDAFGYGASTFSGLVLDAATGAPKGGNTPWTFSGPAPAFDNGLGYFLEGNTLIARNVQTYAEVWRRSSTGQFTSAPIVINGNVYEGSLEGLVYVYNGLNGQLIQSLNAGASITYPDEHNVSRPLTGFGAGIGLFVVAAGNRLVAFGPKNAAIPEPGSITLLACSLGVCFLRNRKRPRIW